MADGVLTFNRDGAILIMNPPAEMFLQNWYHNQAAKDAPLPEGLSALLAKVVETEKEQTDEIEINGRYYVMIASPLYNLSRIRGVVTIIRDMTEERKLDKLRDDFIANVSHELRTPVAMLQGYSEAIIDDIAASEEEKKEFAKIIYDETLRIGRLVNELLDLARMEAGHFSFRMEPVSFNSFIERVTHKFNGIAKEKGIDLVCETSDSDLTLEIDADRIEQVLTNLIDNALRHTSSNGYVKVKRKKHPAAYMYTSKTTDPVYRMRICRLYLNAFTKRIKQGRAANREQGWALRLLKTLSKGMVAGSLSKAN